MGISFNTKGNWKNTFDFLNNASNLNARSRSIMEKIGQEGVKALQENTPILTGRLASSWGYHIEYGNEKSTIVWTNDDIENGENVALLVQYGHGTKSGKYIAGRDMITPAIQPLFDNFIEILWKEVIGK